VGQVRLPAARVVLAASLLVVALLAATARSARADDPCATGAKAYDVQTTQDETDGGDGVLSLREAVAAAQAHTGHDTIRLPAGTYALASTLTLQDDAGCTTTVTGAGARATTIAPAPGFTALVASGQATLSGLAIQGASNPGGSGGAILNNGTLILDRVALVANRAYRGAGVSSAGGLTVTRSTIAGNVASGGTAPSGGGIEITAGTFQVTESTIVRNVAGPGDSGQGGTGGGVHVAASSAPNDLAADTFDANQALGSGATGGSVAGGGHIDDDILAGGVPANCDGAQGTNDSNADNLSSDATCVAHFHGVDPLLGPLQDNGGPTDTEAPAAGSLAIDHGDQPLCATLTADQRGVAIPNDPNVASSFGGPCDLGALEVVQTADLGITASVAPASATIGDVLTYAALVSSALAPGSAPSLAFDSAHPVVTDVLPASLQPVSASPGCAIAGQTVTCDAGALPNGASVAVQVTARVAAAGTIANTLRVSSPRPDANAADDSSTVTTVAMARAPSGDDTKTTAPSALLKLTRVSLSAKRFRAARSGASISRRRAPVGTNVRFKLSAPARVTFTVQRLVHGHRRGPACVRGPAGRRGRVCVIARTLGSVSLRRPAGARHARFRGRLHGRRLAPGAYRLVVRAAAAGKRTAARTLSFTIVR